MEKQKDVIRSLDQKNIDEKILAMLEIKFSSWIKHNFGSRLMDYPEYLKRESLQESEINENLSFLFCEKIKLDLQKFSEKIFKDFVKNNFITITKH